jgi:cell volume regulation protein A
VNATLEVESGTNDPFAIFLTIVLVEILLVGHKPWLEVVGLLAWEMMIGGVLGYVGGHAVVWVLNRLDLPQGLHAPFVAIAALVVFALTQSIHASGFLAAYIAGLVVGNSSTRAHNTLVAFLDAATWLAQIVMFVVLGLLAWPSRLPETLLPALAVAFTLMLIARPAAVFLCLAPFRFTVREKLFISWVGLRGAVGIFIASIPLLVGLPKGQIYFDVGFVVVLISLLVQGWTIAIAARRLNVALPRSDVSAHRVELDLPGQLGQELVGFPVVADSPYLRRGITPSWAKLTLVIRDERVHTPEEAGPVREGDHVYFLAPPERAQSLDRFFVEAPAVGRPDPAMLGDFFVSGEVTLGALAEVYGLPVAPEATDTPLGVYFTEELGHPPHSGDAVQLGPVTLLAHTVKDGHVVTVGLQLAEPEPRRPPRALRRLRAFMRRALARLPWRR